MFLGDNLLAWLLLAMGGALFVGNLMAIIRPPQTPRADSLEKAPVKRSLIFAGLGLIAALWALATLISKS